MTSFEAIEKRRNNVVHRLKAGTRVVVGPKVRVGGGILGLLLVEVIGVPVGDLGQVLVRGLVVDIEVLARVLGTGEAALRLLIKDLRVVVVRA